MNGERMMAWVDSILEIIPHSNADALELARVKGWQVIVKKGEFQPGDKVIYISIDSWVPTEIAPFLSKGHEPRIYEGIKGERLRTIRLRKELSQGLILPITIIDPFRLPSFEDGADLTDVLGIIKWEPPIPAQLQGQVLGNFPTFFPKTNQNRIQNCYSEMAFLDNHQHGGIDWIVEEKCDGSSCSVFVNFKPEGNYETGVCSRNFQLKINEENKDNTFIKTITEAGYLEHIHKLGQSITIQGELCGPGIQGNKYKLEHHTLFVFDVYLNQQCRYATREERWNILQSLMTLGVKIDQVPHLGTTKIPDSIQSCLSMADGNSKINPQTKREGLVFKTKDVIEGQVVSFKAISNEFLLRFDS